MTDIIPLTGPALPPASGGPPKQLVILLHGVGADGEDLIGLAPFFQQVLPDALFVAPNAPHPFDMAGFGYQWFSLGDFSHENRLRGALAAAPHLDAFIDLLLKNHGLDEGNLVLVGFSQGSMMALHVGLRRARQLAGIIAYSGMLVGPELLRREIRSRPPVLMMHGDADDVLPVAALPAAVQGLEAVDVPVEHDIRPGLGHGIDEEEIRRGMAFLARVFGVQAPPAR
ncbi:MAG: dienelactone hydrolase family protein [Hyphomicrobiales bacterium]|nr:dienelactone hydrolase family protein [Hyphomicrobiales bacterium]MCP5371151.1 dienelactone hydrolase family protein [Hyphomicrobiales bacterium]